MIEDGV